MVYIFKNLLLFVNVMIFYEFSKFQCVSSNVSVQQQPNQYVTRKLTNEKRLIKDLLDNYQVKWGRPVNNMSEKVIVYYGINLVQLLDLDEKNQVLVSNVYSLYEWQDRGLTWDYEDYGGLKTIRLPVHRIWTPDIVLYNYADTRLEEKREALAVIKHDGTVKWRPPSILKSACQIDIVTFPYDVQRCAMKFGSWTYDGDAIDIQFYENRTEISREEYIPSNEWDIIEAPAVRNEKFYSCCKEPYPDLTFYLLIKRRGGFYNYILMLPCVLLSCLTMVLFWLPPESPAKMVLGMNIFTSFFVLLLLLSKNVPSATDRIPLIGAYYCLNMVMIATSTIACTVVVHIFFRGTGRVPVVIRKVFLEFLARIYFMIPPPVLPQQQAQQPTSTPNPANKSHIVSTNPAQTNGSVVNYLNRVASTSQTFQSKFNRQKSQISITSNNEIQKMLAKSCDHIQQQSQTQPATPLPNVKFTNEYNPTNTLPHMNNHHHQPQSQGQQQSQYNVQYHQNSYTELNLSFNLIENDIKEIRDYLRHARKKLEATDAKNKQTNEWKQVALVLDRTLFFCYLIAIIISLILMFPRQVDVLDR